MTHWPPARLTRSWLIRPEADLPPPLPAPAFRPDAVPRAAYGVRGGPRAQTGGGVKCTGRWTLARAEDGAPEQRRTLFSLDFERPDGVRVTARSLETGPDWDRYRAGPGWGEARYQAELHPARGATTSLSRRVPLHWHGLDLWRDWLAHLESDRAWSVRPDPPPAEQVELTRRVGQETVRQTVDVWFAPVVADLWRRGHGVLSCDQGRLTPDDAAPLTLTVDGRGLPPDLAMSAWRAGMAVTGPAGAPQTLRSVAPLHLCHVGVERVRALLTDWRAGQLDMSGVRYRVTATRPPYPDLSDGRHSERRSAPS